MALPATAPLVLDSWFLDRYGPEDWSGLFALFHCTAHLSELSISMQRCGHPGNDHAQYLSTPIPALRDLKFLSGHLGDTACFIAFW
jgi:hypothetical protein